MQVETKLIEVLDGSKRHLLMATKLDPSYSADCSELQRAIMRHAGYDSQDLLLVTNLETNQSTRCPSAWKDRTIATAHLFLLRMAQAWFVKPSAFVLDLEYEFGETEKQRQSEIIKLDAENRAKQELAQ